MLHSQTHPAVAAAGESQRLRIRNLKLGPLAKLFTAMLNLCSEKKAIFACGKE